MTDRPTRTTTHSRIAILRRVRETLHLGVKWLKPNEAAFVASVLDEIADDLEAEASTMSGMAAAAHGDRVKVLRSVARQIRTGIALPARHRSQQITMLMIVESAMHEVAKG